MQLDLSGSKDPPVNVVCSLRGGNSYISVQDSQTFYMDLELQDKNLVMSKLIQHKHNNKKDFKTKHLDMSHAI